MTFKSKFRCCMLHRAPRSSVHDRKTIDQRSNCNCGPTVPTIHAAHVVFHVCRGKHKECQHFSVSSLTSSIREP